MPLNLSGAKKPTFTTLASETAAKNTASEEASVATKTTASKATSAPDTSDTKAKTGMSFLKKGAAAKAALQEAEVQAEAKKAERDQLWRFFIGADNCGKDYKITFLDGHLDAEGCLDVPMWKEHGYIFVAGKRRNFVCIAQDEPCPLCEGGDEATLMCALTIIDHTPYTIKNGDKAGQVIQQSKKLFAFKRSTLNLLQKHAAKQGGLAGCTFEVSRGGEKSPSVGDSFIFVEKTPLSKLKATYEDLAVPAEMEKELTYYNRAELLALGVKASGKTIGSSMAGTGGAALESEIDF